MNTTKVILEGDTSRFAFGIRFQKDPDSGAGATREESLSWGGFQFWVEGQNLCAHREQEVLVEHAHWYLLPLFEWFSACWDELLHEERLPLRVAGDSSWESLQATEKTPPALETNDEERWDVTWQRWWLRHSILACRQGGLFPDVVFRRWRDRVEVSWGRRRLAGQPSYFQFITEKGFARFPVAQVAGPIYSVLWQASDYLVSQASDSDRFIKLRDGLDSLKVGRDPKRIALLAGLGDTVGKQEQRWEEEVVTRLKTKPEAAKAALSGIDPEELFIAGSCQAALMFGSVAPTIDSADAMALAAKLIDLYAPNSESGALLALVQPEPINDSNMRPWTQGYELAEDVLDELSLPGSADESVNVRAIYDRLGVSIDNLALKDRGIRAVSIAGPEHRPTTLLNPTSVFSSAEVGRRFTLAHELCHILFDRDHGARLAIASGPWAPSDLEARANAFAAMLLMPTELVRRVARGLPIELATVDGVRQMASTMKTSFKATLEHLLNLHFLSEEEHDRIEVEVEG
jgi:Zn-dependent peptidase ImmA (M78 family)